MPSTAHELAIHQSVVHTVGTHSLAKLIDRRLYTVRVPSSTLTLTHPPISTGVCLLILTTSRSLRYVIYPFTLSVLN